MDQSLKFFPQKIFFLFFPRGGFFGRMPPPYFRGILIPGFLIHRGQIFFFT